jgi:hypothetical protein
MQANLNRGMTRQRKGKGNAETSKTVPPLTIRVKFLLFFCLFVWLFFWLV